MEPCILIHGNGNFWLTGFSPIRGKRPPVGNTNSMRTGGSGGRYWDSDQGLLLLFASGDGVCRCTLGGKGPPVGNNNPRVGGARAAAVGIVSGSLLLFAPGGGVCRGTFGEKGHAGKCSPQQDLHCGVFRPFRAKGFCRRPGARKPPLPKPLPMRIDLQR